MRDGEKRFKTRQEGQTEGVTEKEQTDSGSSGRQAGFKDLHQSWGKQPSKKPFSCPSLGSSFQRGTLFMKRRRQGCGGRGVGRGSRGPGRHGNKLGLWPPQQPAARTLPAPGAAAPAVGAPARPPEARHPVAGAGGVGGATQGGEGVKRGGPEQRVRPCIRHLSAHPLPVHASWRLSSPPVSCDLPCMPGRRQQ